MKNPLEILLAIDRLEVGPVHLERRSLTAPYRVTRGRKSEATDLQYRYEEDVFDPSAPASRNLAALVAAQVALNYGLFCREIVFHDPLDAADRRFLHEAAENTAREILVKKFLEPNPFLRGPAAAFASSAPAGLRRASYLQAKLVFAGPEETGPPGRPRGAGGGPPGAAGYADPARYAVLSSGGKESLLSFGLLAELGLQPHPLFVNESGRHWFTALNAYRHLRANCPETARVWTSADRVFGWMLRHLPFVRPDFARLRADEYPIRLWTVAVFLFGVLPLVRARGIGRVVIGDEYDTTRRGVRRGIPHYDGLYDQSIYFDRALSRFYQEKGWEISQGSLVRNLSEFLVEGILVRRYPELQRHQVSCHAASVKGGRVRPCGRCEKCRRVVAMLTAHGADPRACGYTRAQAAAALRAIAARQELHQEAEGVRHLVWLLRKTGAIPAGSPAARGARAHPEIEKIRVHPERAPADALPSEIRERLLALLLPHTGGVVEWRDGRWVVCRTGVRRASARRPAAGGRGVGRAPRGEPRYLLAEMTWPEARERLHASDTALLPVGSIEQHGPHLPLDVDAWDADYLARRVAAACSEPRPIVLPLISYGVSYHHEDFSGTLSVNPETLARLVYEVGVSAARHGVKKLIIVNGHGGNIPALKFGAQMINRDTRIFTCVETGDTSDADVARLRETPNDVHAGEVETSTMLATRPELVRLEEARAFVPRYPSQYLESDSLRSVDWYVRTSRVSPTGVLGDPTRASRQKGERIWQVTIRHLVAFVETVKRLSLDELHERKF